MRKSRDRSCLKTRRLEEPDRYTSQHDREAIYSAGNNYKQEKWKAETYSKLVSDIKD